MSVSKEHPAVERRGDLTSPDRSAEETGFGVRQMTIAHVLAGPWLEQTQTWLYHQIRHLPATVESHVFCESVKNLDQFPLPNIHSWEGSRGARMDRWLRAAGLRRHWGFVDRGIRETRAVILHSHFGPVGWENCRLARRRGLRHVVTFYGLDVNYLPRHGWAPRYPELFDLADLILCEGPFMRRCVEELGCPDHKIRVHHLGVDVESIEFRPRSWSGQGELRVLIAASFREKKGIPYAIEALGRIQRDVPLSITILGDAGSTPGEQAEKAKILRTIEMNRLGPMVRMLGYQPYSRFFAEAYRHHIFIAPSITASTGDTEGGAPVSLIDVAATGMPVISTRHCDIPEVIEDGVTGLLADERDVDGLADHLRSLIAHPDSWGPMLAVGRRRVETQFDARRQSQDLARLYGEVLSGADRNP